MEVEMTNLTTYVVLACFMVGLVLAINYVVQPAAHIVETMNHVSAALDHH
jgi:hypothetical protein